MQYAIYNNKQTHKTLHVTRICATTIYNFINLLLADSGMAFKGLSRAFVPDIAVEKPVTQLKDTDLDTESTVL